MATYKFALQDTDRPFGLCEQIPGTAWSEGSRHTTLSAAQKALGKARAEMARYCGPSGWDRNFRIVALVDTTMTSSDYCPTCFRELRQSYVWPAGQTSPYATLPPCQNPICVATRQMRAAEERAWADAWMADEGRQEREQHANDPYYPEPA